jgi:RimJ/RimL family protein N-acetyltransferase
MTTLATLIRTLVNDSETGRPIPFGNLGVTTEALMAQIDGKVFRQDDYTVIQIPGIPTWLWSHRLAYDKPPQTGDFERWTHDYRQAFLYNPHIKQYCFTWDDNEDESGEDQAFLDDGFRVLRHAVLHTAHPTLPLEANQDFEVRPIQTDKEWDEVIDCTLDGLLKPDDPHNNVDYITVCFRRYQQITAQHPSVWLGAFDGDRVVGTLGVFAFGTAARYQGVVVRKDYRKQGIARRLTYEGARHAQEHLGAHQLVITCDVDSSAQRAYEDVGFRMVHMERGLLKRPPKEGSP